MPLYTEGFSDRQNIAPDELSVGTGEYAGKVIGNWWDESLSPVALAAAKEAAITATSSAANYVNQTARLPIFGVSGPVDSETARERIKAAGIPYFHVPDDGIDTHALDFLIERKQAEQKRAEILARPHSTTGAIAGNVGGFLSNVADPLNILASMVPVVGEERYAALLDAAQTRFARAGLRAERGFQQGLVGTAVAEPFRYAAEQYLGADYTMADSMQNIALGGFLGAGLHVAGGAARDLLYPGWYKRAAAGEPGPLPLKSDTPAAGDVEIAAATGRLSNAELQTASADPQVKAWIDRVANDPAVLPGLRTASAETVALRQLAPELRAELEAEIQANKPAPLPPPSLGQRAVNGKPLSEMSLEEIGAARETLHTQEVTDLTEIFGDEKTATKFHRLSASNSDSAYAQSERMVEELPPEKRAMLEDWEHGSGKYASSATLDDVKNLLSDLDTGLLDDSSPESLGRSLRYAILNIGTKTDPAKMNSKELGAYLTFKEAMRIAHAKGWNLADVSKAALEAAKDRFSDPADAEFMLSRFLKKAEGKALPAERKGPVEGELVNEDGTVHAPSEPASQPAADLAALDRGEIPERFKDRIALKVAGNRLANAVADLYNLPTQGSAAHLIANASPETRAAAFKAFALQMLGGHEPDVEAIIKADPAVQQILAASGRDTTVPDATATAQRVAASDRLADPQASAAVAAAAKPGPSEAVQAVTDMLNSDMERLNEKLTSRTDGPKIAEALKPFDDEIAKAEATAAAYRAAAVCGGSR